MGRHQAKKRRRCKELTGKDFSLKKGARILRLLNETSTRRGNESEVTVIDALKLLSGAVEFQANAKYSTEDLAGEDIQIKVTMPKKVQNRYGVSILREKNLSFPLQIKSSYSSAKEFISNGNGKIPVLVRMPGAGPDDIKNALTRIITRLQKGEEKIIEVAKLNSN